MFRKGKKHFRRQFHLFDMLFVTKGTLYMKEHDKHYSVREGQYMILAPDFEHQGDYPCEEDTEFFWVHFSFSSPYQLIEEKNMDWSKIIKRNSSYTQSELYDLYLPRFGTFQRKDQAKELFSNLVQANESNEPSARMKQQCSFFDIITLIQKNALELPSSAQNVANQCMNYIKTHYKKEDFRVQTMAQQLLYHPDYLTRALKKTIGMSPIQYVNHCRITKAKKMLQQENVDLKTIAIESGFKDVSYFSRVFKRKEGMTPGQYRRVSFSNYMNLNKIGKKQ
ncbi:AraC family transcriptional regulator [Salipaludibacillus keqinensis]|nr:response regulator transcription factor [Salipaludibacillus keqinensis]